MANEQEPRRGRRRLRPLLLLGILLAVGVLLVGWNRTAASPRFCGTCHAMDDSVASAERSVHANVSCLACHERPGLLGSLRYAPTFAREGIATVTGWDIAHGVLDPRSCIECHSDLTTNPNLKAAHQTEAACSSCHGAVSHPPLTGIQPRATPVATGFPHPSGWTQSHGQAVAEDPGSCLTCHPTNFCETCHFKAQFPHPAGWITKHGPVEEQQGAEACTSCHPSTFCVGCHGTQIPHQVNWLGEHWRALQDGASVTPCLLCHPKTDCTTCHSRHGIHREQDLFAKGPP
jgi:hypothetical protein